MSDHKFKIGQTVAFRPMRSAIPASSQGYKIIRLLPAEGTDLIYRIKGVGEAFERIAKERELTRK